MVPSSSPLTFTVFHLFCGLGGGALGFQQAQESWHGHPAQFQTLGGVDSDPEACADFATLTGTPATCLDLFTRQDYLAFHGHEPGPDWHEATPEDLRQAAGGHRPDVIFASPPCKGFSALLPAKQAASPKYEALSRLTVRGLALALTAWSDNLPGLILLENVPRITSRGQRVLATIQSLLSAAGYLLDERTHDLGSVGGLAQHRRRYLLVARLPTKVPALLYQVPSRSVRAIGSVLGSLPSPDAPEAGPLHRLPRLQWRTWVRLALIPAGGDWRNLPAIPPEPYILPVDPSSDSHHRPSLAGSVKSSLSPDGEAPTLRLGHQPRAGVYQVAPWDEPSSTIVGHARVGGSNGVAAVADPRLTCTPRSGAYRVQAWDVPASTVTAHGDVHNQGSASVADPRLPAHSSGTWTIVALDGTWHRPLTTLELVALQGLPTHLPNGDPLTLAGNSQARWRERIGNAVPVPAAKAIASTMLRTLIGAQVGQFLWSVYLTAVWVRLRTHQRILTLHS